MGSLYSYGSVGKSIFRNAHALDRDFVPPVLQGREEEEKKLSRLWGAVLDERPLSQVMVYGQSGCGKTAVAKSQRIELQKAAMGRGRNVRVAYVSCASNKETGSVINVIVQLIRRIDESIDIPDRGLSLNEYYTRLWHTIDSVMGHVVVVLDEIDKLSPEDLNSLLYQLSRAGENEYLTKSRLVITGITNKLDIDTLYDSKVRSSFHPTNLLFNPYNAETLRSILTHRASLAFEDGVVSEDILAYLAHRSANEHGDARLAINLLQLAGTHASERGAEALTMEDVSAAQAEFDRAIMLDTVERQGIHQRLILYALLSKPKLETREVIREYHKLCALLSAQPMADTRVSHTLTVLGGINLLEMSYVHRGKGGNTREIQLSPAIPRELLKELAKKEFHRTDDDDTN